MTTIVNEPHMDGRSTRMRPCHASLKASIGPGNFWGHSLWAVQIFLGCTLVLGMSLIAGWRISFVRVLSKVGIRKAGAGLSLPHALLQGESLACFARHHPLWSPSRYPEGPP